MSVELQEIIFRVTETTYGIPDPHIPDGTLVILVQDGEAKIGKYEEPSVNDPMPRFAHPKNNEDLREEALAIVMKEFPDVVKSDYSRVFTCPQSLVEKTIWQ